ncbi:MAG: hypothetical protein LiPW41_518 [Parcubacteria group bacterium LiPW_41]|nr:MAG: hypothetical protein LiPW41_518 [Parcubacteria group bacterium LiPW_41]
MKKKKFTLVGYSETDYGDQKVHLRSVKLIYTDEKGNLYRGIFADDETTIKFIK